MKDTLYSKEKQQAVNFCLMDCSLQRAELPTVRHRTQLSHEGMP